MEQVGNLPITLTESEEGLMNIIATPAFARTPCRDCGDLIKVGQQITSAVDGFRHGDCVTVMQRETQGLLAS